MKFYFIITICICLGCSTKQPCQFPQQKCDALITDGPKHRTNLVKKLKEHITHKNYKHKPLCEIVSDIDDMLDVVESHKNINAKWVRFKLSSLRDAFPDRMTKRIFSKYMKVPLEQCLLINNCKITPQIHKSLLCYLCVLNQTLSEKCGFLDVDCKCVE